MEARGAAVLFFVLAITLRVVTGADSDLRSSDRTFKAAWDGPGNVSISEPQFDVLVDHKDTWADLQTAALGLSDKKVKSVRIPSTTAKCPSAPVGYFLRSSVDPSPGAYKLKTRNGTLSQLAQQCKETVFCVAFDTLGNFWSGIKNDSLVKVASKKPCYGIYIQKSPKKWVGLASAFEPKLQAARENGQVLLQQQQAFWEQVATVRTAIKDLDQLDLNSDATLNRVTEVLGLNNDLRTRRLLGATNSTSKKGAVKKILNAAAAPRVWDPRNPATTGGVSYACPVMNQGECGSCQAFSAVGAAEIAIGFARKQWCPMRLSQQWMFFCNGMFQPKCEDGWMPTEASQVLRSKGGASYNCFPYTGYPGCNNQCGSGLGGPPGKFMTQTFGPNAIADAKQFLREKGAIYTYLDAYSDLMDYNGGVYQHTYGKNEGGHSVVVVGYNDDEQAWIMRNSWGTGWGEAGYAKFSYNDPVFMQGDYYNIVGVSYVEDPMSNTASPPPAYNRNPPPSYNRNPPPAWQPATPPPDQNFPDNTGALGLLCSVTFYAQPNFGGLALKLKWPRYLTPSESGCAYLADFGTTSPSFAYKAVGYKLSCSCQGTYLPSMCYELASNFKLFAWRQSFSYFQNNYITDPDRGAMYFLPTDCSATSCNYAVSQMSSGTWDNPGWYKAINSAALCWQNDGFGPWST